MGILSHFAQSADYYSDYHDTYQYGTDYGDGTTAMVISLIFFIFMFIAAVIGYVIHAFLLGRIFKKAGVEQWVAWVPFYNTWKMLEIGGQQGFWAVLAIIPFVNIASLVFYYIASYHIGLKLQKEGWFVLFAIFLPIVWLIWLAVDDSKWDDKKGAASLTPLKTAKESTAKASAVS